MSNYSPAQPGPEQAAQAKAIFHSLYRSQRIFTKLRFTLWAAFGKGLYACLDTQVPHEEIISQYSYADQLERKNAKKGRKLKKKARPSYDAYKPDPHVPRPVVPQPEPEPQPARRRRTSRPTEDE